jgi:hypothetical protein
MLFLLPGIFAKAAAGKEPIPCKENLPFTVATALPCVKYQTMIINLSKRFQFSRDENEYSGRYIFTNNKSSDGQSDVCLEMNVSVNENEEKVYRVNKPTAILFHSNEVIEEMIADEVVAFSSASKNN